MAVRRRALIIVNPATGWSRSAQRRLARVVAALERRGCTAIVRRAGPTIGDAEQLAREAGAEIDIIVAAGGDGTLNAVVNGIAGTPRPVALLPLGTANVLAHETALPRDSERLAELIANGPARAVWPGRVDGRLFLTTASSGFDAEVVATVDPHLKHRFGRIAFAWTILVRLCRYQSIRLSVRIDADDHSAAAIIAARSRFYAGPFVVALEADLAEPMLHLVLFQRSGRLAVICYLAALLLGRLPRRRDVTLLRCRTAVVSGPDSIPVQADGDIVSRLPVSIDIAEEPVWLVRP